MATPARDYRAIHAIADRLKPALRRKFLQAVAQLQERISFAAIERALRAGGVTIELSQALQLFPRDLQPAVRILNEAFAHAAKATASRLALRSSLTLTNPAVDAADRRSVLLVREITDQTRRSLQRILTRAQVEGIAPREAARLIQPLIGLTQKQADAVFARWLAQGNAAAARYAAQLLRHRAEMIARTETIRASIDGQLASWRDAQSRGFLPLRATKRWITTPDDRLCPQCAPLHGMEVPIDALFPGGVDGPPLHPRCRCALSIGSFGQRAAA